ncbi:WD40 repeat domain-containing protein [Candidatus Parcubacteria bacterium]|nr:WD40 repeat domain-containing protein [Candidatus Parcubacteria bacterium]
MKYSMIKIYKTFFVLLTLCILANLFTPSILFAEYKPDIPSGQNIPKLQVTPDDPKLVDGHVYPSWGPICQRYTYSVIYLDDKGRPPEYVKIYFNGNMIDMEKKNLEDNDYLKGVKYIYKYVPIKLGSNFFFFEASNGLGKTRSNIIDSPDNGPVLFKSAFDKNEIAVIDVNKQTKILSYDVKDEWVGGIALSDDGKYLAAKTHKKIYLFDTSKPKEPVWIYGEVEERQGDVKGGVDISGDGTRIIASIGGSAILFDSQSNKPLWVYKGSGNQAYNVAISKDGKYMAMGTAGGVSSTIQGYQSSETTNLLILWNEKSEVPLWQYHAEGNFHDVSLSDDGSFITGATGCPDRRFYLFSKDSNRPIIRSEMLTRDSPVHRAKISGDGKFAAVGSELDDGAVFLFSKDSSLPAWKAPMPDRSSVRALNLTADGNYIGAATFKGDVFIFGRDSNDPISHWKVDASLGGIDIAEDGNFVATGGTDNKLRIFRKGASEVFSIDFNEYVQEIDISANGKYIAAGTGGSVYFFEAFDDDTQVVECKEIIEPPVESTDRKSGNIKTDSVPKTTSIKTIWPGMLFGFGFLASFLSLVIYIVVSKFDLISKIKTGIFKKSVVTTGTEGIKARNKLNKKIIIIMAIVGIVFLLLMTISVIVKSKNEKLLVPNQENLNTKKEELQEIGCGNSMCEPDFGETKANCPQDCTEGI